MPERPPERTRGYPRGVRFVLPLALLLAGCPTGDPTTPDPAAPPPVRLRVMTFNGGTTQGLAHDAPPDDGYTQEMADLADSTYENSLSWNPAEAALTSFLEEVRPDVVVFQEIFWDGWCDAIDPDPTLDFVCRDASADRPLQVQRLLGPDYDTACAPGQPDNCAGVRRDALRFADCDGHCQEGMDGMGPPSGCNSSARVSDATLVTPEGAELVLVNVHGTSGLSAEDRNCRVDQFAQVFEDRGDGRPAAHGAANLVMGDLNTDPFAFPAEASAAKWSEWVGEGKAFHYVSPSDPDGPATYQGGLRIDHIASDVLLTEDCFVAGSTPGVAPVTDAVYWDHRPVACDVLWSPTD